MDDQNDVNQVPVKVFLPIKLSLRTYFVLMFFAIAFISGIVGYSLASTNSNTATPQTSSNKARSTMTPTLAPGSDGDIPYYKMTGTMSTDTNSYDELTIYVDEWKNGVMTHLQNDYRMAFKVQSGIKYPFAFNRLDPRVTYIFSPSACHSDANGVCHELAKNIVITSCSGKIQNGNCIVKASEDGQGFVDFVIRDSGNPAATSSASNKLILLLH